MHPETCQAIQITQRLTAVF